MRSAERSKTRYASASKALWFALLLINPSAFAEVYSGRVVGITDGDTIIVLHNGKGEKVRLNGIDCPERRQAFGTRARQFTSGLAFGKEITLRVTGRDRYGAAEPNFSR
jgi:micrococcal nuclease